MFKIAGSIGYILYVDMIDSTSIDTKNGDAIRQIGSDLTNDWIVGSLNEAFQRGLNFGA